MGRYGKRLKQSVAAALVCCALGLSPVFAAPADGSAAWQGESPAGGILLVNKSHKLPDAYEAKVDLVTARNCFGKEFQLERETCEHFLSLRDDLMQSGIQIELESACRSVDYQKKLTAQIGGAFSLPFEMGARLPLQKPEPENGMWLVSVPVDVNLAMHEAKVQIPADDNVHKGWLPFSENNVIRQSFRFLGDLYGWGGSEGGVDCASLVADMYRTMGVDLPGDSVEQRIGMPKLVPMAGKSREQRLSAIEKLRPGDFLFTEEHVMLYLGRDAGGEPRIIHACSSRWFPGEGEENGPLKYYTRRVVADDLYWYKSATEQLVDKLVAVGGVRKK